MYDCRIINEYMLCAYIMYGHWMCVCVRKFHVNWLHVSWIWPMNWRRGYQTATSPFFSRIWTCSGLIRGDPKFGQGLGMSPLYRWSASVCMGWVWLSCQLATCVTNTTYALATEWWFWYQPAIGGEVCVLSPFDMKLTYRFVHVCVAVGDCESLYHSTYTNSTHPVPANQAWVLPLTLFVLSLFQQRGASAGLWQSSHSPWVAWFMVITRTDRVGQHEVGCSSPSVHLSVCLCEERKSPKCSNLV